MPRCFWLLFYKDLLEGPAGPEGDRAGPKDQVSFGHQSGSPAHGDAQTAGTQRHRHQACEGERAGLPAGLLGFLHQE